MKPLEPPIWPFRASYQIQDSRGPSARIASGTAGQKPFPLPVAGSENDRSRKTTRLSEKAERPNGYRADDDNVVSSWL